MLEYVPIKEFKRFLLEHGVIWNGKVFRMKDGKYVQDDMATKDYGSYNRGGLSVLATIPNSADGNFLMRVSETELVFYDDSFDLSIVIDLSDEWVNHLIDNHIWEYGPIARNYAVEQMNKCKKYADDKVAYYNKKIEGIKVKIEDVRKEEEVTTQKMRKILEKTRVKYKDL